MTERPGTLRVCTPLVEVTTVTCEVPRSGLTEAFPVTRTWIGLPTSGLFCIHSGRDEHLVHQAVGVVFPAGIEYRMTHPVDGGDTDVALMFRADVTDEALPALAERIRVTHLDLRARQMLGVLLAALRRPDDARIDELALDLLRALAGNLVPTTARMPSAALRKRIDRVRIALAGRPELPWTIESLARLAGCSPYHLAHSFRACTGTSVHRYLVDLRLAAALRRIESGDESLATLAADLGFSHHSHLTASLRRRLGVTPRAVRAELSQAAAAAKN